VADVLSSAQQRVVDFVLGEEERLRRHLVVALSGAHAYGFASPDSDLDLKGVHLLPTEALLGLGRSATAANRMQVIDGVEVDYSSNEIQQVLAGILQGNGNFIERILGALPLRTSPALAELQPLVKQSLSRRLHRHYQGFATGQLTEWEKTGGRSVKKLLYVLRTTLTGAHALLTGEIVTDVSTLLGPFGFEAAVELIEQKRRGELATLPLEVAERWRGEMPRAFSALADALSTSPLPAESPNALELEEWLVAFRQRNLSG
jgi:uncharacterized protein